MASITKRRNGDGSTSWDAMVRIVGYPRPGILAYQARGRIVAGRMEAAAEGLTLASSRGMTVAHNEENFNPACRSDTR